MSVASVSTTGPIRTFLATARNEVGVQEDPIGSNAGRQVNQYLKATGLGGGYFWCAAFVAWCGIQAAAAVAGDGFDNWPLPTSADCDVILFKAKKLGVIHSEPQVGDLFLVMASPSDAIHTGIVTGVNADGSVQTIEGNSNNNGSSNGYCVASRAKRRSGNLLFVRWIDTVEIPANPWRVVLRATSGGETLICTAFLQDGYAYVPVRTYLQKLGLDDSTLKWNDEAQGVDYLGKLLPVHITRRGAGECWGRLRQLAAYNGLAVDPDAASRVIRVFRPK